MTGANTPDQKRVATIVKAVAVAILLPPIIRGVTGYYPSDMSWMIPMCVIGLVLFFIGDRIG